VPRRAPTPRAKRRATSRASKREEAKLRQDLERLALLSPGGSPDHPIDVESPTQVDVRAETMPCPLCGGHLGLEEHAAKTIGKERLRVARCRCLECGEKREIYFRLVPALDS